MVDDRQPRPLAWRAVFLVDGAALELVADGLFTLGALGVEEQPGPDGRVRLLAGMPDRESAEAAAARFGGTVEPIVDDGWADAWRAWARPVRVGSLLVQPAWLPPADPAANPAVEHVIVLEPGRAFGSGAHETTRLALEVLLEQSPRGARLLDVGCGSGVLAVSLAVARGATVVAVDTDAHALDVTRANAEHNGVSARVEASSTTVEQLAHSAERFDVVVANILAVTLRELAPSLARLVAPGGVLVLSGMLVEQAPSVDAVYAGEGLTPAGEHTAGGWAARWYRSA